MPHPSNQNPNLDLHEAGNRETSAAALWPPLRPCIAGERRLGCFMAQRWWTVASYEFLRFGVKQGWACLFGGIAVGLMIATWRFYPAGAQLARYDFLFLCMIAVQVALVAGRLETPDEVKIILIYHIVGTAMEIFKTSVGSWIYPEPNFFRIGGVPLFTGFMYSCIGSYLCRAWRLFDLRFSRHPRRSGLIALSVAIYVNFFTHHFMPDLRLLLFVAATLLFGRTKVHFRAWREWRSMPLLFGFVLVSLFIWLSENIGTFTKIWLYPSQRHGWSMVSYEKLGSWFLLLIISYTLVSLINAQRTFVPEASKAPRPLRIPTNNAKPMLWRRQPWWLSTTAPEVLQSPQRRSIRKELALACPPAASPSSCQPFASPVPHLPPAAAAISTPLSPASRPKRPRPASRKA